ncbi:MAG: hypothetical protein QM817_39505 [Archangium sp.]
MLLTAVLALSFAADPLDTTFAAAKVSSVPASEVAFGKSVAVRMPFWFAGDNRVALFDEAGHVTVMNPDAPEAAYTALPFDGAVDDLTVLFGAQLTATDVCAHTRRQGFECLHVSGDVFQALRTQRAAIKHLTFPSLEGKVDALGSRTQLCVVSKGTTTCVQPRVDVVGKNVRARLVAPAAADWPADFCSLRDGKVTCKGSGAFGRVGDGSTDVKEREATLPLDGIVELAQTLRTTCARNANDETWCWGVAPEGWRFEPAATEQLPLCVLDRATMDATWKKRIADEQEQVKQCAATCGTRKVLDACLGCVAHPFPKEPVYARGAPCEEPQFAGDRTQPGWPQLSEMSTKPRVVFTSKPARLVFDGGAVKSVAGVQYRLCAVTADGVLHCASAY